MAGTKKKQTGTRAPAKKGVKAAANKKTNEKEAARVVSAIEVIGVGVIALAVVSMVVLLTTNEVTNAYKALLLGLAGKGALLLPFLILWAGLLIAFSSKGARDVGRITLMALLVPIAAGMAHILEAGVIARSMKAPGWLNFIAQSFFLRAGTGAIGALLSYPLYVALGQWGGFAVLGFLFLIDVMMMKQFSLHAMKDRAQDYLQVKNEALRKRREEYAVAREARRQERQEREAEFAAPSPFATWEIQQGGTLAAQLPEDAPKEGVGSLTDRLEPPPSLKGRRGKKRRALFEEDMQALYDEGSAQPPEFAFGEGDPGAPWAPARDKKTASGRVEDPPEFVLADDRTPKPKRGAPEPAQDRRPAEDIPSAELSLFSDEDPPIDAPGAERLVREAFEPDFPEELSPEPAWDVPNARGELIGGVEDLSEYESDDSSIGAAVDVPSPFVFERLTTRERRRKPLGERQERQDGPEADAPPAKLRIDGTPLKTPRRAQEEKERDIMDFVEYSYPPVDLLAEAKQSVDRNSFKRDQEKAAKLEETLANFGINAHLTGIAHGPAVTRFELSPAPGIKVSRITALADDIALGLAAVSVRIEAPIPGKAAVGVEIPNDIIETVPLREVLESENARAYASRLAVALGKDNSGRYIVADLAKMPHLLIAGATGSGKSVCINTIICSILYRATPDEVRMIMVDPKVVELSVYNGIPHLLVPVVTDPKKAAGALNWAVSEMTDRYNRFAERGARDIKGYNLKCGPDEKPMPQIVIIIDELADLMAITPGEVEDSIARLAQLARAAGIHLVIATQRPSVNIITGVIKANIPSRIAFTVASSVDSRTILDIGGAEKLLGRGDMLYAPSGTNKPLRVQGSWVSDEEVNAIVEYIKQRHGAEYNSEVIEHLNSALGEEEEAEEDDQELDELFAQAVEIALESGQTSISMLQRRLRIGYARAGRLVDDMSSRGIIGPADGAKPRSVLITREQYQALFAGKH